MSKTFGDAKFAAEAVDYGFDWSAALPDGVAISSSTWAATPPGLTLSNPQVQGARTRVRVAGGAADTLYVLSNTLLLGNGETVVNQAMLFVKQ